MTVAEWESAVLRLARRAGKAHDAWLRADAKVWKTKNDRDFRVAVRAVEAAAKAHDAALKDMEGSMVGLWLRRRKGQGKGV